MMKHEDILTRVRWAMKLIEDHDRSEGNSRDLDIAYEHLQAILDGEEEASVKEKALAVFTGRTRGQCEAWMPPFRVDLPGGLPWRPCSSRARHRRDGHACCGVHLHAKNIHWEPELPSGVDELTPPGMLPDGTLNVVGGDDEDA